MTTPSSDVLVRPDFDAIEHDVEWLRLGIEGHDRTDIDGGCPLTIAEHGEDIASRLAPLLAYARAAAEKIETLEKERDEARQQRTCGAVVCEEARASLTADLTRAREEASRLHEMCVRYKSEAEANRVSVAEWMRLEDVEAENTRLREALGRLRERLGGARPSRNVRLTAEGWVEVAAAAIADIDAVLSGSTSTETPVPFTSPAHLAAWRAHVIEDGHECDSNHLTMILAMCDEIKRLRGGSTSTETSPAWETFIAADGQPAIRRKTSPAREGETER